MATIASALETPFTPAATPFYIQVTGPGQAFLQARGNGSAPWAAITAPIGGSQGAGIVQNPVAGVQYQFVATAGTPAVLAVQ